MTKFVYWPGADLVDTVLSKLGWVFELDKTEVAQLRLLPCRVV